MLMHSVLGRRSLGSALRSLFVPAALLALAAPGCSSSETGGEGGAGGGDEPSGATTTDGATQAATSGGAPEFPDGSGQPPNQALPYPPGPYGFGEGAVIENFELQGFLNASVQNTTLEPIELAMFYNPTGDGVYPAGSPMGEGNPKPRVLLIDVGAVWCGPCNMEASQILPARHASYAPMGEFLAVLADGPNVGTPATPTHLVNWTNNYDVDYPMALDPANKLMALFEADAFPQNMMIDLRTMEIVEIVAGTPDEAFWAEFESLLD